MKYNVCTYILYTANHQYIVRIVDRWDLYKYRRAFFENRRTFLRQVIHWSGKSHCWTWPLTWATLSTAFTQLHLSCRPMNVNVRCDLFFDAFRSQSKAGWPDWANFCLLGHCLLRVVFENDKIRPNYWASSCHGKRSLLILQRSNWAAFFGYFFTNSSGHPDRKATIYRLQAGRWAHV
jgi:hypothetical protein